MADLVVGVSDLDPGALRGVATIAANAARGDYQYRLSDTDPWVNPGSVSATGALLLSAEGTARIRLTSPAWSVGTVADGLTYRAWDQSSGAAGTKVDTVLNGGAGAFSTAPDQVSFSITPIVGQPIAISSGSFAQQQHVLASDANGDFVTITRDRATGAFSMQRFTAAGVNGDQRARHLTERRSPPARQRRNRRRNYSRPHGPLSPIGHDSRCPRR